MALSRYFSNRLEKHPRKQGAGVPRPDYFSLVRGVLGDFWKHWNTRFCAKKFRFFLRFRFFVFTKISLFFAKRPEKSKKSPIPTRSPGRFSNFFHGHFCPFWDKLEVRFFCKKGIKFNSFADPAQAVQVTKKLSKHEMTACRRVFMAATLFSDFGPPKGKNGHFAQF